MTSIEGLGAEVIQHRPDFDTARLWIDSQLSLNTTINHMQLLDRIPWGILIILAVLLGLAPFAPEPHIVEKLRMLTGGNLRRPIDIFDLFYHGLPILLLLAKILRTLIIRKQPTH